jgi:hypothetical protein
MTTSIANNNTTVFGLVFRNVNGETMLMRIRCRNPRNGDAFFALPRDVLMCAQEVYNLTHETCLKNRNFGNASPQAMHPANFSSFDDVPVEYDALSYSKKIKSFMVGQLVRFVQPVAPSPAHDNATVLDIEDDMIVEEVEYEIEKERQSLRDEALALRKEDLASFNAMWMGGIR